MKTKVLSGLLCLLLALSLLAACSVDCGISEDSAVTVEPSSAPTPEASVLSGLIVRVADTSGKPC
jgi:uncharacterized lipoprotein YajG